MLGLDLPRRIKAPWRARNTGEKSKPSLIFKKIIRRWGCGDRQKNTWLHQLFLINKNKPHSKWTSSIVLFRHHSLHSSLATTTANFFLVFNQVHRQGNGILTNLNKKIVGMLPREAINNIYSERERKIILTAFILYYLSTFK